MIVKMQKVEIMGEKEYLDSTLDTLQELGFVHLETPPEGEHPLRKTSLGEHEHEERRKLKSSLQDVLEMEKNLGIKEDVETPVGMKLDEVIGGVNELKNEYLKILKKEREVREEIRSLKDYQRILEGILPLLEKVKEEEMSFIGVTVPRSEVRILELLKDLLKEKVGEEVKVEVSDIRRERVAAIIVVEKEKEEIVRKLIWEEGLTQLRLPDKYEGMPLREIVEKMEDELRGLPLVLDKILEEKAKFSEKIKKKLLEYKKWILTRLDFLEAKENFSALSRFVFLLRVWVPNEKIKILREVLYKKFGDSVFIVNKEPDKHEFKRVPVLLKNPSFLRPFELLLSIFEPPIYGTVDPTPFLYIFFPIYFGFMLGDVGYGGIGFLLFSFLYRASKPGSLMRRVASLFLWTMFWSIVFGILYGEAFGDIGEHLGMRPLLLHRTHEVMTFLLISIVFGVIQVLLGILLGIYNQFKLGHIKHGLFEIFRFIGLSGLVVAILGAKGILPGIFSTIGAISFGISAIVVLFLHGIAAPLEIVSAAGNVLSFARLMAIGLASAILASISNLLGRMMGMVVFTILVALTFHLLAFILGLFDPSVQGLRLQFVEFFSKFYITGGRPYKPFERGGGSYAS